MFCIEEDNGAVAPAIEFVGQVENVGGTRFATEFTPFAAVHVDDDSSFCHDKFPPL